jgi:hypothetical protein
MKKIILITTLLFSSLATAQWCTGTPNQNLDAARANFKAACGETYNDQKGHVCDYKSDGFHCNGNISASSSPTQTPAPVNQQPPATSSGNDGNTSPVSGEFDVNRQPYLVVISDHATGAPKLEWAPVTGAAGYNVYRNDKYINTVSQPTGSRDIARFLDNTTTGSGNEYYVVAFDASKENFGPRSNTAHIINISTPTIPAGTPTGITMRAIGDSIIFDWDTTPTSSNHTYEILSFPEAGGGVVARTSNTSLILTGLSAGPHNYGIRLATAHSPGDYYYEPYTGGSGIEVSESQVRLVREGRIPYLGTSANQGRELIPLNGNANGDLETPAGAIIQLSETGITITSPVSNNGSTLQASYEADGSTLIDISVITPGANSAALIDFSGGDDDREDRDLDLTADSATAVLVSPDGATMDVLTLNYDTGEIQRTHHTGPPGTFSHLADDGRDNGGDNGGGGDCEDCPPPVTYVQDCPSNGGECVGP